MDSEAFQTILVTVLDRLDVSDLKKKSDFLALSKTGKPGGSFGPFGSSATLKLLGRSDIIDAFSLLREERDNELKQLPVLMFFYLSPLYLEHCVQTKGLEEQNDVKVVWAPNPGAIYLMLCVVDWYLPVLYPDVRYQIGGLREWSKNSQPDGAIMERAMNLIRNNPTTQSVEEATFDALKCMHPIHHFGLCVDTIHNIYKFYEQWHVHSQVYERWNDIWTAANGVYLSSFDNMTHRLPKSTFESQRESENQNRSCLPDSEQWETD
jgi:hypothetical protein